MKEAFIIRDQSKIYFITPTVVDWVDVFTSKAYRDCVAECLDYCIQNKGMILYGYVIMSNHIHMVVQASDGNLSDLIRDFKMYIAKTIVTNLKNESGSRSEWMLARFKLAQGHTMDQNYQFWQYGNLPEEVCSRKSMRSKLAYIHQNPVRAGIVSRASDYIYSSASNYDYDHGVVGNIKLYPESFSKDLKSSSLT